MSDIFDLPSLHSRFSERQTPHASSGPTLPSPEALQAAESSLPDPTSPTYLQGLSDLDTANHIIKDIVPALTGQARSSRYYGFVTGGVLPVAEWADNIVSRTDQNVQVHLPSQTVATAVEDSALEMLMRLLRLDVNGLTWQGRTFTTGATGSNILGLACGREVVVGKMLGCEKEGIGELGVLGACMKAGISEIQVLTSAGHSSLSKAASVVGLGRQSVKDLRRSEDQPWRLDIDAVERELKRPGTVSIIAISAGDVNTGGYALEGRSEWERVRELADRHGAWIHVDGAMGVFARALGDEPSYRVLHQKIDGVELADSITLDGHKLLNVPYDCGMFFTRSASTLSSVFVNPNAAYLASGAPATIPSPLHIGLENSRRFRALPAYAVLLSEGRPGIDKLLANMVDLTRRLATFLRESPHYHLLPDEDAPLEGIFMIVMFRAKDSAINDKLVDKINHTREMYVSGTSWKGEKAVRIAVSNWKVDVERDFAVVTGILNAVAEGLQFDIKKC
ncbi:hypothetical protein QQS21_008309 [Conoideocrella luteorostrata]|uniref:Pyridoxal-dependent decarboxylase n=1 Tax=Conoideocrella luteorostrata TaxID=1105319 RepID=A0AAJ0FRK1_9HYPO|nr:hypothetical protein QQS21_008309 [Conoideocrella luteorostrata]